jgi:hypothetical protein
MSNMQVPLQPMGSVECGPHLLKTARLLLRHPELTVRQVRRARGSLQIALRTVLETLQRWT